MHSILNVRKLKVSCTDNDVLGTFLANVNNSVSAQEELSDIIIGAVDYPDYSNVNLQDKWYEDGFPFWLMTDAAQFIDQASMLAILSTIAVNHDDITITPHIEFSKTNEFDLFVNMHGSKEFELLQVNGLGENLIDAGVLNDLIVKHKDVSSNMNVIFDTHDKYLFRLKHDTISVSGFYSNSNGIHKHAFSKRVEKPIKDFIQMVFDGAAGAFTLEYYYDVNKFIVHKLFIGISNELVSPNILSVPEVKSALDVMSTRYVYME